MGDMMIATTFSPTGLARVSSVFSFLFLGATLTASDMVLIIFEGPIFNVTIHGVAFFFSGLGRPFLFNEEVHMLQQP